MIKGILFDLDGVLADTEVLSGRAADAALAEVGIEKTEEEQVAAFGRRDIDIMSDIVAARDLDLDPQDLIKRKGEIFQQIAPGNLEALPGALELLEELDERGFGLAVVSSSTREKLNLVLQETGLFKYFKVQVSAEHVERGKPAPDAFLKGAELMDIPPEECLVLEDAEHGITAAKAAGMRCIAVRSPNTHSQDLSGADLIIESLSDFDVNILYGM